MNLQKNMSLLEKLTILSDAAKYDVACTSSGIDRKGTGRGMGNAIAPGVCHSFSADGRCISLLKILFTNECIFNCAYCLNNCGTDVARASFTPEEICTLTMEFYRRNYIEGLFLSSGILISPNYTMDLIYQTIYQLRNVHHFQGYIHVKSIPGADPLLIEKTGFLVDRMSVNLELPTADGLRRLAPCKSRNTILKPMRQIQNRITDNKQELTVYREAPRFVPAGQSTQMIIGATPENDFQIMSVAEGLYQKFQLKRVFYSAFVNVEYFPVEINKASYQTLLRVPGIGYKSAERIVKARKRNRLNFDDLKKIGVVLKRALYFITCSGKMMYNTKLEENYICENLMRDKTQLF